MIVKLFKQFIAFFKSLFTSSKPKTDKTYKPTRSNPLLGIWEDADGFALNFRKEGKFNGSTQQGIFEGDYVYTHNTLNFLNIKYKGMVNLIILEGVVNYIILGKELNLKKHYSSYTHTFKRQ